MKWLAIGLAAWCGVSVFLAACWARAHRRPVQRGVRARLRHQSAGGGCVVSAAFTREQVDALTPDDYEIGRKAVEDVLIEFRDDRISLPFRNNGLVVKEYDGTPSDVIRLGVEAALKIALRAMTEADQ